jgi:hypothetical protein
MQGMSEETVRKLTFGNAAKLYGLEQVGNTIKIAAE